MNVIAFNGSPRRGGNTEMLIETVFGPLRAAGIACERIDVAHGPLRGCTACYACMGNGGSCVLPDSLNDWFAKASAASAIIIGSPTYFANVSAETKALLDRFGLLARVTGNFVRKPFAAVVAVRRAGAVAAFDAINHMAQINQMLIVGATYWNLGIGREKGQVADDEEGLDNMRNLGETLAWLIDRLK